MKKVVICLIVILIIAILGVEGWFLFDNLQKEKSRTNELESKVTAMESKNKIIIQMKKTKIKAIQMNQKMKNQKKIVLKHMIV